MHRRTWLKLVGTAGLLGAGGFAYYRHQYPFGWSHSCDQLLAVALDLYADRHDGWYPKGEASPEASLSLLHRADPGSIDAEPLRGKTVPATAVRDRLDRGELLSPETCGWHYAEGLRQDDDPTLALFWDKAGLGHNGEVLPDGGHHVCFLRANIRYVTGAEWGTFLEEQKEMRSRLVHRA